MSGHTNLLQATCLLSSGFYVSCSDAVPCCDTCCVVESCTGLCHNMRRLQVVTFAGELLDKAEDLLKEGLNTTEVADGYQVAADKVCILGWLHSLRTRRARCMEATGLGKYSVQSSIQSPMTQHSVGREGCNHVCAHEPVSSSLWMHTWIPPG